MLNFVLESHSQVWQAHVIVSRIPTAIPARGAGTYQSSTSTGEESTKPCENWSVPPCLGHCEFNNNWTHPHKISQDINVQHIRSSNLFYDICTSDRFKSYRSGRSRITLRARSVLMISIIFGNSSCIIFAVVRSTLLLLDFSSEYFMLS